MPPLDPSVQAARTAPAATAARRIGGRIAWGAAAAALVAIPFTLLTVLVLAKSPGLARLDLGAANRLHALVVGRPGLDTALVWVGRVTEPWWLRAVTLLAGVVLWRRGARRPAGWVVGTMAVAGLLSLVLKQLVSRARPTFTDPVTVAGGYSFPSGHALNSMAFAACAVVLLHPVLARRGRTLLWGLAAAFVLLVGFDRIALGVHYVSDVLAGWTVGLATVLATAAMFDRGRLRPLTPDPEHPDPEHPAETPLSAGPALDPDDPPSAPRRREAP